MSKVIETADTFCWKLCFLITSMISLLKKKDGIQTVKEYFKLTMAHLLEYDEWHQEMADLFLDVYRSKIQPLVAGDDGKSNDEECEDAIIEFVSDCNKWGTVDNTSEVVLDYWQAWYFIAVGILQSKSSKQYKNDFYFTHLANVNKSYT